ncbi:MAG: peptidoglycan-associated lipoprotein Pal [Deltaproteobacteria bacterium]|nr:peptidoglycan-associated lipoprotein Pal [Deltaproteobacteria bacterium]MBW2192745.1 peptidoglycan-associated lipoprotein Pal [Deltaproteobacteria bacterium]
MQKKLWTGLALLLIVPGMLLTTSCAKKTVMSEPAVTQADEDEAARKAAEEARRRALEEEQIREDAAMSEGDAATKAFTMEDIYFDYDRSDLTSAAQDVLREKAAWLRTHPDVAVYIEGHCDERGTNEYNLALGDRRAEGAKSFLVDLGVASSRMTTISYGEERPVDTGTNEEAWAKNRRAHFVVE